MAKNTVPVNFKDDIINSSMGGKRRYKIINNSDGTISLEDATTYDQVGSNFGAAQMNATNQAVNAAADAGKIIDDIETIRNVTEEGYIAGALALKKVGDSLAYIGNTVETLPSNTTTYTATENCYILVNGETDGITVTNNGVANITLTLNNGFKKRAIMPMQSGYGLFVSCPMRKGQTVTISKVNMGTLTIQIFK